MIDWEIVRLVFYLSLVVGAPICFFHFVDKAKAEDDNARQNSLDLITSDRMKTEREELHNEKKKLLESLTAKDAIIKERDLEIAKMRPLLKYVRTVPDPGAASSSDSGFDDDL